MKRPKDMKTRKEFLALGHELNKLSDDALMLVVRGLRVSRERKNTSPRKRKTVSPTYFAFTDHLCLCEGDLYQALRLTSSQLPPKGTKRRLLVKLP